MSINWPGMLALGKLRFVREARDRRLHLHRFAAALVLVLVAGNEVAGVLHGEAGGMMFVRSSAHLASMLLTSVVAALAVLAGLRAGGELSGVGASQAIALVSLTRLRPFEVVIASWVSLLLRIALSSLVVVPVLAALTLVGGADPGLLAAAALSILLTVMELAALGYLVSPGARSPIAGIGRVVACLVLGLVGLMLLNALSPGLMEGLTLWLEPVVPFAPVEYVSSGNATAHPFAPAVVAGLGLSALLLRIASARLARRFTTAPDRVRPRPRPDAANVAAVERHGGPPDGVRPLDWLATVPGRRQRRRMQAIGLCILALGPAAFITRQGQAGLNADEYQAGLLAVSALVCALLAIGGPMGIWSRLRARGLLPVLLASPLTSGSFLRASLRAAAASVLPFLAVFLPLLSVFSLREGLVEPQVLLRLGADFVLAVVVLAVAGTMAGIESAASGARHRFRVDALLVLCAGGFAIETAITFLAQRSWPENRGPGFVLVVALGAVGLVALFLRVESRRLMLLRPVVALALVAGLTSYALDEDDWMMLFNPVAGMVLAVAPTFDGQPQNAVAEPWIAPSLLAAAVVLLVWLERRLDRVFGRA